ncbi:MAG: DNA/RNA nuclease SfsA [Robiginitomaculum sp.]|nr:DNA/RNA nuclease SfsA [Robiginitomaculum sp.]
MRYDPPLICGKLLKRYKRFLADIEFADGEIRTVHCANPGSMLGLIELGNGVFVSDSQNPKRKLLYSLELIDLGNTLVSVNTHLANKLAEEAINANLIQQLSGYDTIRREVKYGQNSRIDLLLEHQSRRRCYVEVKSVTLSRTSGLAEFPDSVTKRGAKHLFELSEQVKSGNRAVQLFVIQRSDCQKFSPADDIDPEYAKALAVAQNAGVEIIAMACNINAQENYITHEIPVQL